MKIIMKYFSCEGRFSRVYSYHIRLLMHFTRVKMLNIPYYPFRSVEKMAYIVQKREPKDQMKSLFHHALIKIIVPYHLKELNIAWSTFIANPIFTHASTQNVQNMPSSLHPPPPPLTTSHAPIPSPNRKQDNGKENQGNRGQSSKSGRTGLGTMVHTYQKGCRQVFAPHILGGAFLSSSAKQVHKGKEKVAETEMQQQEEHLHETEQDFNLVDLDEEGEQKNTIMLIKEQKELIGELQVNLQRSKYNISYYK